MLLTDVPNQQPDSLYFHSFFPASSVWHIISAIIGYVCIYTVSKKRPPLYFWITYRKKQRFW